VRRILPLVILSILPVEASLSQENFSYYILKQELKVLSATGEETSLSEVPRYTIVITREEIDRLGAKNLFELLDKLPEFYVRRSFFGLRAVGALGIRQSYFSEKVQVLIDGVPTLDPSNGSSFSTNNNYSLDNVKQVEITYGPMTSLYGFNASLAVINLVTYDSDDVNSDFRVSGSTGGDDDLNFIKSFSKGGFKGILSVNYNQWKTPHGSYRDSLGVSGVYSPFSKHSSIYLKLNHESGFFLKSYVVDRDDHFPVSISHLFSGGDSTYADRRAFINQLGFRSELGGWDLELKGNLNFFFLERGYNLCPKNHQICSLAPYGVLAVEKRHVREPGVGLKLDRKGSLGDFLIGVDYYEVDLYKSTISATFFPSSLREVAPQIAAMVAGFPVDMNSIVSKLDNFPKRELPSSESLLMEKSRYVFSPYVQYFFSTEDSFYLFNLRWHKTSDVGRDLSASFSYRKNLTRNLNFKLNLGRAVRIPSFEEMYIKNNSFLLGNPKLDSEKEDSVMPSLEYSGDTFLVSGFLYYSRFHDFIYKRKLSSVTWKWDNSGTTVKVKGLSLSLKKRFSDSWDVGFSFNRVFSVKGVPEEGVSFPRNKFVSGITYDKGALSLNLSTVAYSRVSSTPGFYRTDLNLRYSLSKNLSLMFQVINLTNKNYTYSDNVPGEERTLWLGLHYSY